MGRKEDIISIRTSSENDSYRISSSLGKVQTNRFDEQEILKSLPTFLKEYFPKQVE